MKALFIFLLVATFSAHATDGHSLRRCVLLPITDSVGGAIGGKVFTQLELDLKEGTWCQYQSNSELLGIFSRYRENLPQHLKTPAVVKVVADKLKAGSIIRVNLVSELNGMDVQLEVVGPDGETIIFAEKTNLPKDDLELVGETLRNWLELHGRSLPYDGKITGILGDQVTMDFGKNHQVQIGQDFVVKRYRGVKKHPLLKKVVEWESRPLANGKVFSLSEAQAVGMVKVYRSDAKLEVGDWIRLEKPKADTALDELRYPEKDKDSFGKLGLASAYLVLAKSSLGASKDGNKRLGGLTYGFQGKAEAWVTRNWFGLLEFGRSLGSLKKSSGVLSDSKSDYQRGSFKLGGGWKYLPLGFFYGPQVDLYAGYGSHVYKADYSEEDGLGEFGINGIMAGVATNFPVGPSNRGILRAEFIPFPSFEDEDSVYGGSKTTSFLQLELGMRHQWSPNLMFDVLVEMTSAKATFKGDVKSVSAQDTALKAGASFNF